MKYFLQLRKLDAIYPNFPSEQDFIRFILSYGNLEQLSEGGRFCHLAWFVMDLKRLQVGGELLPDLVEFYQWIHTNLSLRVTKQHASSITIRKVIDLAVKNAKGESGKHLRSLYERLRKNCRRYMVASNETSIARTYETVTRRKKIVINDNTHLLCLLSGKLLALV